MNGSAKRLAIPGLRWAVGLVVLWQSLEFVFSESSARAFAHTGLPAWIRPVLGGIEMIAAIIFLVPAATIVGGYALLFVFLTAVIIHILHGWYDVGALVVYAMAVLVCIAHHERPLVGGCV
jgi:DoxX-like family